MSGSAAFDFTGSVVLVTGGGTGIGLAITRAFLAAGATVAITGRRTHVLEAALADAPPDRAAAISADLSDPAQVRGVVADVVERFGRLDVVVSNAAGYANGELPDLADEAWEAMRATNVDGFFHLAKARRSRTSSQAGYNATKAAISNFVQSLALDHGAQGVRFNAVAPAATDTDITHEVLQDDVVRSGFENRIALGRVGQPDDIAPAVLFLASDAARYITGVNLPVDGGTSASTGQAHL